MASDTELLKEYVGGSQEAFAAVVSRHIGWVYSSARRRVGDEHLAEDVTQAVFILLAQKAWKIRSGTPTARWLFETTRHVSRHAVRARQTRSRHEKAARERELLVQDPSTRAVECELADLLDESVRKLKVADQQAILLRFYRQMSLAEIGRETGTSEDSARKRVRRALDRLRAVVEAAGLSMAPAALGQWMEANMMRTVPTHLGQTSSAAALAGFSGGGSAIHLAKGVSRMFMWTKLRLAAAILFVILAPGILCVDILLKWARAEDERPAATAPTATKDVVWDNYTMATDIMLERSVDGTKMWGFSMATGGKWAVATAPAGATFDKSTVSAATGIGVIQAGNELFGFSPGTGTWDHFTLPDNKRANVWLATHILCVHASDRVYAMSGLVPGWDSFDVPHGVQVEITVGIDWATVHYGTHLWAFSATGGKWRGIDIAETTAGKL